MLYLASQSPRRKDLLTQLGIPFAVLPPPAGVDMEHLEAVRGKEAPLTYVRRVTVAKLQAALPRLNPSDAVLVADTTVALGRSILGKPGSAAANAAMLAQLQGQTHRVHTAVAVYTQGKVHQTVCTSRVQFAPLSPAQISDYAASGEGWDKAGGYAIQGKAGAFVARIHGNYSGIMGLPLYKTAKLLTAAGLARLPC